EVDIRTELITEDGKLVDKGYLGSQEAVGCVFGQLRTLDVHDKHRVVSRADEGAVKLLEEFCSADVVRSDDHPVRPHEVLDGIAFLEKFRVGHYVELHVFKQPGI